MQLLRIRRVDDKLEICPTFSGDSVQNLTDQSVSSTPENYNLASMRIQPWTSTYTIDPGWHFRSDPGLWLAGTRTRPAKLTNQHPDVHRNYHSSGIAAAAPGQVTTMTDDFRYQRRDGRRRRCDDARSPAGCIRVGSSGAKDRIGHGVWIEKVPFWGLHMRSNRQTATGPAYPNRGIRAFEWRRRYLQGPIHKYIRHGGQFGRYTLQKGSWIPSCPLLFSRRGGKWLLFSASSGPRFEVELDYRTPKELSPPQRLPFLENLQSAQSQYALDERE